MSAIIVDQSFVKNATEFLNLTLDYLETFFLVYVGLKNENDVNKKILG
jgi:hypothetical protein